MKNIKILHPKKIALTFSEAKLTGTTLAQACKEKDSVAVNVNNCLQDMEAMIPDEAEVMFINRKSAEGIDILRHSAAHIMAQAVKELYPETQVVIGPSIENGFYYDFCREIPFIPEDVEKIQVQMKKIVERDEPFIREEWTREQAIQYFQKQNDSFKVKIIEELPEKETISVYRQGEFIDLCRGPHLPSTGMLGYGFKLTKVSGSYWRGDAKNQPLQRIYGTAWPSKEKLDEYLRMQAEAEKRGHLRLGHEMDLFHLQDEAPGCVFWHDKGWTLYRVLQNFIREKLQKNGYQEVNTPQMVSRSLWEASGHWSKFDDNMFVIEQGENIYALKPMNCPCHIQIFNQGTKSYRDLPFRMAEFGSCMRNEPSGAISGIMRVRSFVQDDAHIFCTQDQIIPETENFCRLLKEVYEELGFNEIIVRFATRPDKRLGSDEIWDKAEDALQKGADAAGLEYTQFPGEGAFYGPKLEFVLKDALGRLWQCGTFQVDFIMAERLKAFYTASDGNRYHPVMLHRAILGTFERFIGILIEHYGGDFPLWLAPVQGVVATISDESLLYAEEVLRMFKEKGVRVVGDFRNEKISYKIREHMLQKVPYIFIIGKNEMQSRTVVLRRKNEQFTKGLDEAVNFIQNAINTKEE